jgi:hypothetical protein
MNFIEQANKLTTNKYFLYFIIVLAGSNLLGYLSEKNWKAIIIFATIGVMMYYLSKNGDHNIPIALIVAIFGTSFLVSILKNREGIENMDDDMDKLESIDKELKEGVDALKETDGDVSKAKEIIKKHGASKDKGNMVVPVQEDKQNDETDMNDMTNDDMEYGTPEPFSNQKQGFDNYNYNYFDNVAPLDQEYDNLGNNLSEKLKNDSQRLLVHKMNIGNHIASMSPMMETEKNLLKGFDILNIGESITQFATEIMPVGLI